MFDYFKVEFFRVLVECCYNVKGEFVMILEVIVKIMIDEYMYILVVEGNGLVNVLDMVFCVDLGCYVFLIEDLKLIDYKVCILNFGIEVVICVLIESMNGKGEWWFIVGVFVNIVDVFF